MARDDHLLGSDVGGTFTDLVFLNAVDGSVRVEKVRTTPDDPAQAVLSGVDAFRRTDADSIPRVRRVVHATTLVANTLVERSGARTALLVTEGFRDILRLRRHTRVGTFDLYSDPPPPLVQRRLTFPVTERMLASGKVLVPLDDAQVRTIADRLVAAGVEAVAVVFLHSYLNPEHEERVGRILAERVHGVPVALSSRLLRRHMEYERANTTVASAYCAQRLGRYLTELSDGLHDREIRAPLSVMSSAGGFLSAASAREAPVQLVESGPSAGATYVAKLARRLDRADVLAFDMGGTTAKACLIRGGLLPMTTEIEAARAESYRIGSGIPLQIWAVNLIEVGAGGGSIATIDSVGLVRVGPRSAGAHPGPACYLRGGSAATVTDADLVLGHLAPDRFLGGHMRLGLPEARGALAALASDGTDEVEMARVVQEVVTENMSAAVLRHVIERGGDPERLTLVAFGGAGPVHAYALAKRLGVKEILVPPLAGVLSAVGLLTAQPSFRSSRTVKVDLHDIGAGRLAVPVAKLRDEIGAVLRTIDATAVPEYVVHADCAYAGQSAVLSVPVADPDTADGASIAADFAVAYRSTYGYSHDDVAVEVVTVTAEGRLRVAQPELPRDARDGARPDGTRRAWSHHRGRFEEYSVRWRTSLRPGVEAHGPVIIEETESTTVVDVDGSACLDGIGNIRVMVGAEARR